MCCVHVFGCLSEYKWLCVCEDVPVFVVRVLYVYIYVCMYADRDVCVCIYVCVYVHVWHITGGSSFGIASSQPNSTLSFFC